MATKPIVPDVTLEQALALAKQDGHKMIPHRHTGMAGESRESFKCTACGDLLIHYTKNEAVLGADYRPGRPCGKEI